MRIWKRLLTFFFFLFSPVLVFAHEVYVLPKGVIAEGLHDESIHPFDALKDPANLKTTLIIAACILLGLILNFFFQHSALGKRWARFWNYLNPIGPLLIRLVVAISFFYSAYSLSFLGPELSLTAFPFWVVVQIVLYILSIFIFFGLFTEYAAILSLIIFGLAVSVFHLYMMTYINYVGEFLVLMAFGARTYSLDGLLFGPSGWMEKYRKYENLFLRFCFGFGLVYAAINIKFIHAILTLDVVNDYHLTQFHLLFPHDPLLVVLGAGLAEIAIGLFIIFGFQLRLTLIVMLFYVTLSLIFFRELVWPHYILYGIGLNLIFAPNLYSLDSWFDRFFKNPYFKP
ncbi:MAG TPA: DoxX family protein [Candidatus Paceibacterota bacterium]|nr:DoxX family protein [Candidatus Paceibacterota bacterium]